MKRPTRVRAVRRVKRATRPASSALYFFHSRSPKTTKFGRSPSVFFTRDIFTGTPITVSVCSTSPNCSSYESAGLSPSAQRPHLVSRARASVRLLPPRLPPRSHRRPRARPSARERDEGQGRDRRRREPPRAEPPDAVPAMGSGACRRRRRRRRRRRVLNARIHSHRPRSSRSIADASPPSHPPTPRLSRDRNKTWTT